MLQSFCLLILVAAVYTASNNFVYLPNQTTDVAVLVSRGNQQLNQKHQQQPVAKMYGGKYIHKQSQQIKVSTIGNTKRHQQLIYSEDLETIGHGSAHHNLVSQIIIQTVIGDSNSLTYNRQQKGLIKRIKPEVLITKYQLPDEVRQIQQKIVDNYGVKSSKSHTQSPTNAGLLKLPPNTPVHKNYAQNFLPMDRDVVPGSSYIPLVL